MKQPVELTIEKLVYGGYGLAFDGKQAFFILNALPGETVRAEIIRQKKNTSFGRVIEVLTPSPLRITPACPHFMRCGGCHLQHLDYPHQLRFKEQILRETFERLGQMKLAEVEVLTGEPWHYRTRAQFKVARRDEEVEIGFYAAQSHRLWPIDRCPLLADKLNQLLHGIQSERQKFALPGASGKEFQLRTNGDESQSSMDFLGPFPEFEFAAEERSLAPTGYLSYQTRFGKFRVACNSFFQVNRYLIDLLVQKSIEGVSGSTALDLFSGVGLFAIPLAQSFKQVISVEENPSAMNDLRANLESNKIDNVELVRSDVASIQQWDGEKWNDVDFVLLDPPRQGVEKGALRRMVEQRVPNCAYVSCDPTSMARDLKVLMSGGYDIQKTYLFDFFPQTYHFETVVRLQRSD
jgi:23S rRNA (uracil1939-C5)-methyltransferase